MPGHPHAPERAARRRSDGPDPRLRFSNLSSRIAWLYFAVTGEGVGQRTDRRLLFVAPAVEPPPQSPLSLGESWALYDGVYLFLGDDLVDQGVFLARLRVLLTDPALRGARLLWIANPQDGFERWVVTALRVADLTPEGGRLSALAFFDLHNDGVMAAAGTELAVEESTASFRLGPPDGAPKGIWLTARDGAVRLPLLSGALRIPLAGSGARALDFPLEIPSAPTEGGAPIDLLDVGCRYFYPEPSTPGTGLITSQRYPLFDTTRAGLSLRASLDPLSPLDPERTRFAFTQGAETASFFRSNLGRPLSLKPGTAALVFAPKPTTAARTGRGPAPGLPFCLVPTGDFTIGSEAGAEAPGLASKGPDLLCGTAGAEYVALTGSGTLTCFPGQPAYAAAFDPRRTGADGPATSREDPLDSRATTAWVAVSDPAGGELTYFAQPQASILYRHQDVSPCVEQDAGQDGLLRYFPLTAGLLPPEPASGDAYPLVPYAGLGQSLASYGGLETTALSPQRRAVIYRLNKDDPRVMGQARGAGRDGEGIADPCSDPEAKRAVTPQGLIGVFDHSWTTWQCLLLARNEGRLLALRDVAGPLRAALLTNQQFLVSASPSALRDHLAPPHDGVSIADWQIELDPALWSRHGTVMIFKNHEKSLHELVQDLSTWTLAGELNTVPSVTQEQILAALDVPDDESFRPFKELVDDPQWNGILFLNAFVPLTGLPPELRGLAAGIDPARFFAHHVGINQAAVQGDGREMKDSSLFGLIHYTSPAGGQSIGSAYDFQVQRLTVRFANSAVATFASRIAVTLNQLFGAPSRQVGQAGDNAVLLDGVYQRHGDTTRQKETPTYVFNLVRPTRFSLDDAVLEEVGIEKAQLNTLSTEDDGEVRSRFSFWGSLRFAAQAGAGAAGGTETFDLFSFDALAYSQLWLGMSFPTATPSARQFTFVPAEMTFDAARSTAREGSLARHFPLKIARFAQSQSTQKPGDEGYLALQVPVPQQGLSVPWYALVFDLNLGTVGALAAEAGLVASLMTAWSPATQEGRTFVGLKLPGSTGSGNEISIQGVLKITLYSLELLASDGAYLLKLNGINLRFLGKALPPGGSFDFFVFGDPDASAGSDSLGWYGAYLKDQDKSGRNGRPALVPAPPELRSLLEPNAGSPDRTS